MVVSGPYFKSFSGMQDQSNYLLQSMAKLCSLMKFDLHSKIILKKPRPLMKEKESLKKRV